MHPRQGLLFEPEGLRRALPPVGGTPPPANRRGTRDACPLTCEVRNVHGCLRAGHVERTGQMCVRTVVLVLEEIRAYGKQQKLPHAIRPGGHDSHLPSVQIEVLLQARSQRPQWSRLSSRSMHTPPPQQARGLHVEPMPKQLQTPKLHVSPNGHSAPQAPQLSSSVGRLRHPPAQQVWGLGVTGGLWHSKPQLPQLSSSD